MENLEFVFRFYSDEKLRKNGPKCRESKPQSTSAHQMADRALVLNSQLARHRQLLIEEGATCVNSEDRPLFLFSRVFIQTLSSLRDACCFSVLRTRTSVRSRTRPGATLGIAVGVGVAVGEAVALAVGVAVGIGVGVGPVCTVFPAGVQSAYVEYIRATPDDHFIAGPDRCLKFSLGGRVYGAGCPPAICDGIVSPTGVRIGAIISAPDDHFTIAPDCCVQIPARRRVGGVGSCPTVRVRIISASGVKKDARPTSAGPNVPIPFPANCNILSAKA